MKWTLPKSKFLLWIDSYNNMIDFAKILTFDLLARNRIQLMQWYCRLSPFAELKAKLPSSNYKSCFIRWFRFLRNLPWFFIYFRNYRVTNSQYLKELLNDIGMWLMYPVAIHDSFILAYVTLNKAFIRSLNLQPVTSTAFMKDDNLNKFSFQLF